MTRLQILLMFSVATAALGWVLPWPDPARAGYVLQWLGWCGLCSVLMHRADPIVRALSAAGMAVGLLSAGCGAWYPVLSQSVGVCDEATGRPITAAVAAIGLAVLAIWTRGEDACDDTPPQSR